MTDLTIYPTNTDANVRTYTVTRGGAAWGVRVWSEGSEILVSTQIGGPHRITSGEYRTDEDAIRAHFTEGTDDQRRALAQGIDDGWQVAAAGLSEDVFVTIWQRGMVRAEMAYPNGWNGGEMNAECRAAFLGGWAIGVQRYADGLRADGSLPDVELAPDPYTPPGARDHDAYRSGA